MTGSSILSTEQPLRSCPHKRTEGYAPKGAGCGESLARIGVTGNVQLDGGRLLRELKRLEEALHRHLSPRSYKEMALSHFKRQKRTTDHRTHERGEWTSFLEENPGRRR